jgi:hypothetical protein
MVKPFRAVPRKEFGFKVILRVVEEAEAAPKKCAFETIPSDTSPLLRPSLALRACVSR